VARGNADGNGSTGLARLTSPPRLTLAPQRGRTNRSGAHDRDGRSRAPLRCSSGRCWSRSAGLRSRTSAGRRSLAGLFGRSGALPGAMFSRRQDGGFGRPNVDGKPRSRPDSVESRLLGARAVHQVNKCRAKAAVPCADPAFSPSEARSCSQGEHRRPQRKGTRAAGLLHAAATVQVRDAAMKRQGGRGCFMQWRRGGQGALRPLLRSG
jgi:hypothetical protein